MSRRSCDDRHQREASLLWLLGRAFLFSIVLNVAPLCDYILYDGLSPRVFSDGDEPFYLEMGAELAKNFLKEGFIKGGDFQSIIDEIGVVLPHFLSNMLFGLINSAFDLPVALYGLLLDIFFAALSYFLFTRCFRLLVSRQSSAEIGAFCLLGFPWIASVSSYFNAHIFWFETIVSSPFVDYVCVPVLRSVNTQLSYPILALVLFCALKAEEDHNSHLRWEIAAGALSGILLYVYFFAWGVALGVVPLFFLFNRAREGIESLKEAGFGQLLRSLTAFGLSSALVSLPGLLLVFGTDSQDVFEGSQELPTYFFLSPEVLLAFLISTIALSFLQFPPRTRLLLTLFASCLGAELVLMNIQPLVGMHLTPYHFPLFYLQPCCSALFILFVYDSVLARSSLSDFFLKGVFVVVFVVLLTASFTNAYSTIVSRSSRHQEVVELLGFFRKETPSDAVVGAITWKPVFEKEPGQSFHVSLVPLWIESLAERSVVAVPVSLGDIERELGIDLTLGWYYSGTVQLLRQCSAQGPKLPGDLAWGIMTLTDFRRQEICQSAEIATKVMSPCDIITTTPLDYLIWEESIPIEYPDWYQELMTTVWESPSGAYTVLQFDSERAKDIFCLETESGLE